MKILAFAYSCEPDKGSEPGAGWMLAQALATRAEVCVITRANNRPTIEGATLDPKVSANLRFEYVDLPKWARSWKRGQRGMRAYYLLWQFAALRRARRLTSETPFDCVWHLTIANAWIGSTAAFVGLPFIYGPVGGGVRAPLSLLPSLGARGLAYECFRELARQGSRYLNPLARVSWRNADAVLVQNTETADWLPPRYKNKARIFQNAGVEEIRTRPQQPLGTTAVLAARLLPWKGGALAIRAISHLNGWRLIVCGSGPDEARLLRLAAKLGVADRVDLRGRLSQQELFQIYESEADVFLYPSLHDDSPLAVAEAVASGLPVVCLDVGGPALIAREAATVVASKRGPKVVAKELAGALQTARSAPPVGEKTVRSLMMSTRAEELHALAEKAINP